MSTATHDEWLREQGRQPDPSGACWQQFQSSQGVVVHCTCGYDRSGWLTGQASGAGQAQEQDTKHKPAGQSPITRSR